MVTQYKEEGWCHISNYLSEHWTMIVSAIGLEMRHKVSEYSKWKGISCAGRFDYRLTEMYTSMEMYALARQFLGDEMYFFNDQIVYKLPNEESFAFEPHYDNQYGPNADNEIHTVNLCCILDDFESPLNVKGKDGWISLYPKRGDVVAIRGDTYHGSPGNTGNARGLYACVYTEKPLYMEDFYYSRFTSNDIRKSYIDVAKYSKKTLDFNTRI